MRRQTPEPPSFLETSGWEEQRAVRSEELYSPAIMQRWTMMGGVLLAGLLVGGIVLLVGGTDKGDNWIVAGSVSLVALLLVLRRFDWCVLAFLLIAWLNIGSPEVAKGSTGSQRLLLAQLGLMGLLGAWGVRQLLQPALRKYAITTEPRLHKHPLFFPSLLYIIISSWSTLHNHLYPDDVAIRASGLPIFYQVNLIEVLIRVLMLGSVFMLAQTLKGKTREQAMALLVLPGILIFILTLIWKKTTLVESHYIVFPQLVSLALLTLWGIGKNTNIWLRMGAWVMGLAMLKVIVIDGLEWVSGWGAALIALTFITWHLRRKLIWVGVALGIALTIFQWNFIYKKVYVNNFYVKAGQGTYGNTSRSLGRAAGTFENDRTRMWSAAFRYAETFPLGIGLGNYRTYNAYYGRPSVWNTTRFTSAHSTYAQSLSETGWLGLLSLLYLLGTCMRVLYRYWKYLSPITHLKEKNFLLATLAVTIGVFIMSLIGDYIFPSFHNGGLRTFGEIVYIWFFIGVAMAIGRDCGLEAALFHPVKEKPLIAPYWGHALAKEEMPDAETSPRLLESAQGASK
jgi:O-antigen ligase